jgi:hypothetical protein
MRSVKRILTVLVLAAAAAGCGGTAGRLVEPPDDPGAVMTRVIRLELAGNLDRSWRMLIREQRRIVDLSLYRRCAIGPPVAEAKVVILGVADETFDVAALGRTKTKAVHWRLTTNEVGVGKVTVSHTGHLIAQDGSWHWTLSSTSLEQLRSGNCP